ncbi:alpha/beta hydrolase [Clostridium sp. 'White wine YQ']|uniref:alpha/beta hydrolase n=1 Tax=Clostridium sp. 'White wine YQ' TaxID=3027474 RepID=UPI0023650598|nr:alpha/beta hydrolase [Clostridium sp. 'White wine YQ']MDD7794748.1 lysophospholipase [Clostridium sp. 'White wine YQ']
MVDKLTAEDGKSLYIYCWDKVDNPKGMIQIFHGMAEHSGRYKEFAEYLNSNGFIVYSSDHRGHGKTADTAEEIGIIGENGFNAIVEDKHLIFEQMKQEHPELPMFLLGHSFGSFLAQEYIIRYGKELKGVVLSGSAAQKGAEVYLGGLISSFQRMISGEKKQSKLLDTLSFGNYNKRFKEDGHKFSWLSTDLKEVKKYEEDPFCGTVFSIGFFYYLMKGLSNLYKKERLNLIQKELPIYIISGENDPVGGDGKLVKRLFEIYKEIGIRDVKMKLYPSLRHEILNEVKKKEVYEDILNWLNHIYS